MVQHSSATRWLAAAALGVLAIAPALAPNPLKAATGSRTGMRNLRYCEVLVVKRHRARFQAAVYNTLGLNDCPAAAWARVDANALKKQLDAVAIVKNGPRYMLMDAQSFTVPGEIASFDGLQARLVATLAVKARDVIGGVKQPPYQEHTVERTTVYTFLAGKPVYELAAPNGKIYAMQAYSQIIDPNQTMASLASLGKRLKLPAGWKFRVVVPKTDLLVKAIGGTAYIVQDELQNTYQRVN